ncbi:VOC family protein [Nannocystis pusilla]|uniref:VOC family protein n=1 Tax=Nannocystis pusilla TaxID=889268 RepID=UPI0023EE6633|nr:VOC family protein [Nannocystis pusilla]
MSVQITGCAVSLTVDDVAASSAFFIKHLGFREAMAADGFASLQREDAGMHVVLLRRGIEVLPPELREQRAAGVIVAFVVKDLEGEERRLRAEGVPITLPLREEPWGERLFMITDPNGVVIELVEWAAASAA